ncbi:zinc finger and SCAN domain-containing protein 31-like [Rhineura floridana]|uniref:zinc finger and SCAN domain-containing protein 31-like n=1 Tax=Rhineura floridana TaxID=261503 RepID=UPI002AC869A4|nr:zinc finger and SCAN domain-containing protein 31-like [Rhineura floridana]
MAAEDGEVAALGLHLCAVLEKGMKMEELEPVEPGRNSPPAVWAGSLGERPKKSEGVKGETEEGLQQRWDAQWQHFLKAVESTQSEGRTSSTGDSESFLPSLEGVADHRQERGGKRWAQRTGSNDQLARHEAGCKLLKEEFPEEEEEEVDSPEVQRQHFRQFRYLEAEGPREAYNRLRELCHQWLEPERHTKEQILELVILEQFLAILPHEIQNPVLQGGPEACFHAVALAEDFLLRQLEEQMPFKEEAGNSPKTEMAPPHPWKGTLFNKVKQEDEADATWSGGDEKPCRFQASQPENPRELESCRILGEQHVPHYPDRRTAASEGGAYPEKEGDTLFPHSLLAQENSHSGEKRYKCSVCEKSFKHKSTLTVHKRTHTGERPYRCSHCEKSFIQRSTLIVHERTHTGERPYRCSDCGKSFNERSVLVKHERTHTGERPYKCVDCEKSYKQLSALAAHERTHTGERPYKCSDCGKSFTRSSFLITHKRTHTGEKPYSCSGCGKSFSQRPHLVIHERTHSGEDPL